MHSAYLLVWLPGFVAATVNLANITVPVAGLSDTCIQVMNQAVNCDASLFTVDTWRFETDQTLAALCVSTCATALSTYLRRVSGSCGSTVRYNGTDGNSYSVLFRAQWYTEHYNVACLKNTAGAFCNAVIRDAFHIDPVAQTMTADPDPTASCNDCLISAAQTRLNLPLASSADLASTFTSMTSACSKTGLTTTAPATPKSFYVSSTTTTGSPAVPTCAGDVYTIKSGDTCQSVSAANGVSTTQLIARNGITGYCQDFPAAGTTLCLPDNLRCTTHKVAATDTCTSLATQFNATWVKLVSWNPEVGTYCDRIPKLASYNFSICVSTPGGAWVHPYPDDEPPVETSTTTVETYFTITGTAFSALASPTREVIYPNIGWVPAYGNGTREDCQVYMTPPVIYNHSVDYSCEQAAQAYRASLPDFLSWNPTLQNLTTDTCELSPDEQYCAQLKRVEPAGGITPYCLQYQVAEQGTTDYGDCAAYLATFAIDEASFKEWNGVGCDSFDTGYSYCAAVKHFRPAGEIATCNYWAMSNSTGSTGCAQYVSTFGISQARLLAWNPSIQSDCSGMKRAYDYCIGTPTWHPA